MIVSSVLWEAEQPEDPNTLEAATDGPLVLMDTQLAALQTKGRHLRSRCGKKWPQTCNLQPHLPFLLKDREEH